MRNLFYRLIQSLPVEPTDKNLEEYATEFFTTKKIISFSFWILLWCSIIFLFTPKSEAAIVKVNTNLDTLPFYLNGDDVMHFEFVSDTSTTSNGNYVCIRPNPNYSCTGSSYATYIGGSNYATDTDELTSSTTPYYLYYLNIPLYELFDANSTTSVDITQVYLYWGGVVSYQYRSASVNSSGSVQPRAFRYDKYGHVPIATTTMTSLIPQVQDNPNLNYALGIIIAFMTATLITSLIRRK